VFLAAAGEPERIRRRTFAIPGRRLNPDQVDSEKALERAKALAGAVI